MLLTRQKSSNPSSSFAMGAIRIPPPYEVVFANARSIAATAEPDIPGREENAAEVIVSIDGRKSASAAARLRMYPPRALSQEGSLFAKRPATASSPQPPTQQK